MFVETCFNMSMNFGTRFKLFASKQVKIYLAEALQIELNETCHFQSVFSRNLFSLWFCVEGSCLEEEGRSQKTFGDSGRGKIY